MAGPTRHGVYRGLWWHVCDVVWRVNGNTDRVNGTMENAKSASAQYEGLIRGAVRGPRQRDEWSVQGWRQLQTMRRELDDDGREARSTYQASETMVTTVGTRGKCLKNRRENLERVKKRGSTSDGERSFRDGRRCCGEVSYGRGWKTDGVARSQAGGSKFVLWRRGVTGRRTGLRKGGRILGCAVPRPPRPKRTK